MKRRQFLHHLALGGLLTWIPFHSWYASGHKRKLHIIGLGGAGCRQLIYLWNQGFEAHYMAINQESDLQFPDSFRHLVLNLPLINNGKKLCEENRKYDNKRLIPECVFQEFRYECRYVLVAGLGGYTGTYFLKELSLYLHENGFDFISVTSVPFEFEGRRRGTRARSVLSNLSGLRNFYHFELDEIIHTYGHMTVSEAFTTADGYFFRHISALIRNSRAAISHTRGIG